MPCATNLGNRTLQIEIAERKKTEETLRITAQELAIANRELESFSYSVSHDLRNPLHTIGSFAVYLLEDYTDRLDEEGQDYLRRINDGVKKMQSIIDDMLSLSSIGRHEMNRETVNISAIVLNYLQELKGMQPDRTVEFFIQDNVNVRADPRLIHLALENLLRNAWKFTSKKDITRIEFGTTIKENQTVFFIRDNGEGFDMQFAEKIFEPFKRVHAEKEFGGTGVGLSIVQRVINRHGGSVWAEGEVGMGATFYFTLG
jgi:light-regulated signal transduction histidine kinase (bacteriophytochrome)